jgi:hypothetical protein
MTNKVRYGKDPERKMAHPGVDLYRQIEEVEEDVAAGNRPQKQEGNRENDDNDACDIAESRPVKSRNDASLDSVGPAGGKDAPKQHGNLSDEKIKAHVVTEADGGPNDSTGSKKRPDSGRVVEVATEEETTDEREKKCGIGRVVICHVVDAGEPEDNSGERQSRVSAACEKGGECTADGGDACPNAGVVDAAN